jgi:transcription antitermination factor NusG
MQDESIRVEPEFPRWHVLHVAPNHEKKVAIHLQHRYIEHFLPLYTERSRWSDRNVTLERPLFPGYIFIRIGNDERRAVITVPGALKIIGKKGNEIVENDEIERIRTALTSGYVLRPHPPVSVGTRVRVSNGVFAGTEGMVTELRGNCRVIISMSAVNQDYSLETDSKDIEILDNKIVHAASGSSPAKQYQVKQ